MSRGMKRLLIWGLSAFVFLTSAATVVGVVVVRRMLRWEPTAERCLDYPLPKESRVVADTGTIGPFGGERFFVFEMSWVQYEQFKSAGQFAYRPDLLSYWPGSLDAPPGFPWMAKPVNDEFTVYREAKGVLDVARWENGRLFFRHHVP